MSGQSVSRVSGESVHRAFKDLDFSPNAIEALQKLTDKVGTYTRSEWFFGWDVVESRSVDDGIWGIKRLLDTVTNAYEYRGKFQHGIIGADLVKHLDIWIGSQQDKSVGMSDQIYSYPEIIAVLDNRFEYEPALTRDSCTCYFFVENGDNDDVAGTCSVTNYHRFCGYPWGIN